MHATEEGAKPPERRRRRSRERGKWRHYLPLAVFALIVCGGPLLFGAVDRPVQIGLVALLALGIAARPPMAISTRARWLALAVVGLLVASQFWPWQSASKWRSVLETDLRVELPWTSHPEPARALDALLAAAVATLWLAWVRGLAVERETRVRMFWILAAAGVLVASVCFAVKGPESGKIYGIRPTIGWVGWGPFPNRNHTASFLAMAGLLGVGVACWSIAKQRRHLIVASAIAFVLIVAALLLSKSRGGLVAFGAGMVVFMVAILARHRDRRAWGIVIGLAVVTCALVLVFGGKVLERFRSQEAGGVSNDLRRHIWSDTVVLWRDAPWFGNGLDTFSQVFPIYATRDFDGQMVRHSESSWLLWLSEVGAVPVLAISGLVLVFLIAGIRRAWSAERRSFYLTAAALAGLAAFATHAVFDVPGHRWGTAGFALALLGVAYPARGSIRIGRWRAIAPLAVAAFWIAPFYVKIPWSPTYLTRLDASETAVPSPVPTPQVSRTEWEHALRHFPLDVAGRNHAGIAALAENPPAAKAAERHFAVARRLAGSSWGYPVMEARAYGLRFPGQSIVAWQDAVDRSGRRRVDVLRAAITETAGYPDFSVLWGQFVEQRPELALAYVRALMEEIKAPPEHVRYYFDLWREQRAEVRALPDQEIADFYIVARSFGDPPLLRQWMETHKERWRLDYRDWARLLAHWGEAEEAWTAFARVISDRELGTPPAGTTREMLESQYRASPENPHLALSIAQHYALEGNVPKAEESILRHAQRENAPIWFVQKGGHILAGRRQFTEAVALVLRGK